MIKKTKQIKKQIVIKTTFDAIHQWESAPESVYFLKHPHRHLFYVTLKFIVSHNDRDLEFFLVRKEVDDWINSHWKNKNLGNLSCEDMAETLVTEFGACFVSVFEDNENGAEVEVYV